MKKTFILSIYFLSIISFVFGQNNCGSTLYNITSSELSSGSNIYDLMWQDFGYSNPTGYIFGHNSMGTYEYAEKFTSSTAKVISQIELGVCTAVSNSSNAYIVLKIWNDYNGIPGQCIFANYYSISSFANDVSQGFSTLIPITPILVNSTYYVGYQIFYETVQDQFALYSAVRSGNNPSSTAYIKNASGTNWIDIPSLGVGYNSMSMFIGTITCDVPIDCNFIASKSPVVVGDFVNFYNRSLGNPSTYSWTFSQGNPNTSTNANPTNIYYNTVGSFNVILTASSPTNGQNTAIKNNYIKVIPTAPDVSTNCNNLYNIGSNETIDIIEYDNQEGFLLGHNSWGDSEFAEKFTNSQTKFLTQINLGLGTVVSGSNNSIITFKVWDEQGGLPGNIIGTCSASLSSAASYQNSTMTIVFPTPIEVTGNFFIGFEIFRQHYNDFFCVSSTPLRANESTYPTTTYIRSAPFYGNVWSCANALGYYLSMNMSATLCDPNNNVSNAEFSSSVTTACINANINFNDQSTGTVSNWLWNFGDGNSSSLQNPSHSYASAGQYTVTLSINNGGDIETKTNYITINPSPIVSFSPTSANIICNTAINITAQGGSTYQWSNGLGNNASATISTPNTYYVTVTSSNNCTASGSITIGQTSNPVSIAISPSSSVLTCNATPITLSANGAVSYIWSNNQTGSQIQINAAGTYTVTGTDANGCTGTNSATILPANNDATVTINQPASTILTCTINSIQLTANGNGTYLWNNSMGTSANITATSAGTYTVTVTTANGCTSLDQITITANTIIPPVSFNYSANELNCNTNSITITALPIGMNYNWSNGSTSSTITETSSGNYQITVTNPTNGCIGYGTAQIVENLTQTTATLQLNPNGLTEISCSQPTIQLTVTPTSNNGPFSYSWNYGLGNSNQVLVSTAANYAVTITGSNGCSTILNQNITESQYSPTITINSTANAFDCNTSEITLTAIGNGLFSWSSGLGSNSSVTISNAGTYSVTLTDEYGCTASNQITITDIPEPNINMTDIINVCNTSNFQLPAPTGYNINYQWTYNGANVIEATESGYYTIAVTDNNNCSTSKIIQIFFSTSPTVTNISSIPCSSLTSSDGSATISVNQNNVSYLWNNNSTTQSISNLIPGIYTVTVTNEFGCSVSSQIEVSFFNNITENNYNNISIYPNPNDGNFILSFDNLENIISYEIFDVTEKIIFKKTNNDINLKEEIRLQISNGTYFIKIKSKNTQETKKFIVINK